MPERIAKLAPAPTHHGLRVLVVQKNSRLRTTLLLYLERSGCSVLAVETAEMALDAVEHQGYDVAFVDPRVGPDTGLALTPRLLAEVPDLSVVLIAACSNLQAMASPIEQGTCGHLSESFTPGQVKRLVAKALEERKLRRRLADLQERLGDRLRDAAPESIALSPAMRIASEALLAAAPGDGPVLLRGEPGVGKRLLARLLHAHSPRAGDPMISASCAGPSAEGIEADLFGHAFSQSLPAGAPRGRIEDAEGGTLFLDEIGELPPNLQTRLLRLLQEKTFERVAENRTRRADVRIVAATTSNLEHAVHQGRFREDLFHCLKATEIEVPPLRRRGEDIVPLARSFVKTFARKLRKKTPELTPAAQKVLMNYAWPGNITELRNLIERAVMLGSSAIDVGDFPAEVGRGTASAPQLGGDFTLKEIEREHVLRVTKRVDAAGQAARILGIGTPTLWRKRKAFGAT